MVILKIKEIKKVHDTDIHVNNRKRLVRELNKVKNNTVNNSEIMKCFHSKNTNNKIDNESNMRKNDKLIFGILALVVSLVAITIVYAAFGQRLNINGTGTLKSSKWSVHFDTASYAETANSNVSPATTPTPTGTDLSSQLHSGVMSKSSSSK